jgi:hypothetical protein
MIWTDEHLTAIYERTDGDCHICARRLAFANYGRFGERGAWEVEHSIPRVLGGTDHANNLYAACIPCNRQKRHGSTRSARARYGRTAAPLSAQRKDELRMRNLIYGAMIGLMVAWMLEWPAVVPVLLGAVFGYRMEPDRQRR